MDWQVIFGVMLTMPIILFIGSFLWCLNTGGRHMAIKDALKKRAILQERLKALVDATQHASVIAGGKKQRVEKEFT